MRTNIKKITKIIDEISTFMLAKKAKKLHLDLEEGEKEYTIKFTAYDIKLSKSDITDIKESLGTPRQRDMEEYYWQLGGLNQPEGELELVGMMSDDFSCSYENSIFFITIIRKK